MMFIRAHTQRKRGRVRDIKAPFIFGVLIAIRTTKIISKIACEGKSVKHFPGNLMSKFPLYSHVLNIDAKKFYFFGKKSRERNAL
jgi:hypothetical protein